MTPGEVVRAVESYNRRTRIETQEKATFDYIQANLIVKGVGVVLSGKGSVPTIQEAYPGIFDNLVEQQEQELNKQRDQLSVLRFKQFAQSYNSKFKKEVPK